MKKCLLLFLLIFSALANAQTSKSKNFSLEKLADGVYAAIATVGGHAISNSGIVDLGEGTLIFDDFYTPEAAAELKEAAVQLTGHPIKYVINSHYHDDHIQGNQVFEGVDIISTTGTYDLIADNEPQAIEDDKKGAAAELEKWKNKVVKAGDAHAQEEKKMWIGYYEAIVQALPTLKMVLPNMEFENQLVINGSKRTVLLMSFGGGHTESDCFLYLPKEKIAFLGDLLFVKSQPWLGDGDVNNWEHYLDQITGIDINVFVPGHGPVGDTSSIRAMKAYMQTVVQTAQSYIDKNSSPENDSQLTSPPPYDDWMFSNFFVPNVIALYEKVKKH